MKINKNTSGKWMARLGAVCLLSTLLSSCLKNSNGYYAPPVAFISFIQASPNQPALDFYMNNNKVNVSPVNYGDDIDYFRAYTGQRTVNFYAQGSTSKLFSDTVTLNTNIAYSLFLTNASATSASPAILLLTDSISKPATGKASIRFVNISPDAPAVDLAVKDSAALVSNKVFKGYSSFLPMQGDKTYTFNVLQHGTNTVLATLSNVPVSSGLVYTIWFHGLASSSNVNDKPALGIITNAYYY
jgi:uncharacterized protein DUF4397